jgi:L-ribulose-5-phosphate 4-epimerase
LMTLALEPRISPIEPELLKRHFYRKHGAGAYYGQADDGTDSRRETL